MNTLLHKLMVAVLILPGLVLARPGDIDTGAGPLPVFPIVRPDGSLYQIVPDSSAGILASRRVVMWNARATGGPLGQFEFGNPFGSNLWRIYDPVLLLANGDLLIPAVGPMGGSVPGALVSHLMRVRPDGLRDPGFGSGGVVSLDDESPEAPPRTKRVIAALRELPDGRILILESLWNCGLDQLDYGTYEGRNDGWDLCYYMASSVVRLLGDGRLDTTFGAGGRTKLVSNLGPVMFEARADGGAVIANASGVVQVLDASGRMATVRELGKRIRTMLQQRDGRWLIIRDLDIQPGHIRFARLLADLQPDSSFGTGGEVDLPLGTLLAPRSNVGAAVVTAELSGDATEVFVAMELTAESATPDGSVAPYRCTGVARFRLGPPFELDASFGKGGFSCLTHRYNNFLGQALLRQPDGGLLYSTLADSGWPDPTLRLFTDNSTGTGRIEVTATSVEVGEGSGTATITVSRLAGRAGAIQTDWSTHDSSESGNAASAGLDYAASSGRLSWADGDDSERTISIPILEDSLQETRADSSSPEYFSLDLTVPAPVGPPRVQTVTIGIRDNEPAVAANAGSSSASTSAPASSPSGGGGSTGPLFLLALAGALWRRLRRRGRTARYRCWSRAVAQPVRPCSATFCSQHPMTTWVMVAARGRRTAASARIHAGRCPGGWSGRACRPDRSSGQRAGWRPAAPSSAWCCW